MRIMGDLVFIAGFVIGLLLLACAVVFLTGAVISELRGIIVW